MINQICKKKLKTQEKSELEAQLAARGRRQHDVVIAAAPTTLRYNCTNSSQLKELSPKFTIIDITRIEAYWWGLFYDYIIWYVHHCKNKSKALSLAYQAGFQKPLIALKYCLLYVVVIWCQGFIAKFVPAQEYLGSKTLCREKMLYLRRLHLVSS